MLVQRRRDERILTTVLRLFTGKKRTSTHTDIALPQGALTSRPVLNFDKNAGLASAMGRCEGISRTPEVQHRSLFLSTLS